jgi:hypothetical protein
MNVYRLVRTVHYAADGRGQLRRVRVVNQVLEHAGGGPCLAPVTFPVPAPGGETRLVEVACGRRLRPGDQCDACRVEVEVVEERRVIHRAPDRVEAIDVQRAMQSALVG